MTIKEMKERKTELGLTNEMIAEASGIPLSTVQKIFSGATKTPRKLTLDAIAAVLEKKPDNSSYRLPDNRGNIVRESMPAYNSGNSAKEERLYTLEDYYALPDDARAELIDGKFYYMSAPTALHQSLIMWLSYSFLTCKVSHGIPCDVLISPFDVRLDQDNFTIVQPDLLVICGDFDRVNSKRHEGAPDLVAEVLSPSTRSKDMLLKLYKYQSAGVREYWIADPKNKVVIVHYFEDEDYIPKTYTFDDKIPVGISEGRCVIDFGEIKKHIYG